MIKGQILTDAASEVQRKFYFVELKNKKEDRSQLIQLWYNLDLDNLEKVDHNKYMALDNAIVIAR